MPTYPLATVACTTSSAGITSPSVSDILASYQASVKAIYGSDTYIDPDSQDGQFLALMAQAQFDSNMSTIWAANSYNPQTALGTALDSAVKVNGIVRNVETYSTVPVTLIGQTGVSISNGVVQDKNNNLWNLPSFLEFPDSGEIDTVATAQQPGAIVAAAGAVTIYTVTLGWQSAAFTSSATPGDAVEADGALRIRQALSTSKNAMTASEAILSNVANVTGVVRATLTDNDTGSTDANGVPAHSVAVVVQGGDPAAVAQAIQQAKDIGTGTYGTTTETVLDQTGQPIAINFFELQDVPIYVNLTIKSLPGYSPAVAQQIAVAVAAFINSLQIGEDVYANWLIAVAGLSGPAQQTFVITSLLLGETYPASSGADIAILFNQAAVMPVDANGVPVNDGSGHPYLNLVVT